MWQPSLPKLCCAGAVIFASIVMRHLIPLIVALLATTAHAWGTQGHQVIASRAQHHRADTGRLPLNPQTPIKPPIPT
jgi:hypothetical protein